MVASRDHDHTHNARTEVTPLAHTPGPWRAYSLPLVSHVFDSKGAPEGYRVADVHQYGSKSLPKAEREANARLIAVAPDLVEDGAFLLARLDEFEMAMQGDREAREFYGHVSPAMARFRAAIAKATGDAS